MNRPIEKTVNNLPQEMVAEQPFQRIPQEIFNKIFSYLDEDSVVNFSRTSKENRDRMWSYMWSFNCQICGGEMFINKRFCKQCREDPFFAEWCWYFCENEF